MPTLIQPTQLELELRAVTDGQTASKIARALRRTHGITTRDGLALFYHTRQSDLRQTHNIGAQRFQVIETLLHTPKSIELPDDRLERLTETNAPCPACGALENEEHLITCWLDARRR